MQSSVIDDHGEPRKPVRATKSKEGSNVTSSSPDDGEMPIDPLQFRRVLAHYPTGVCIVTAHLDGRPVGMTIGSFTSVSLDPPLVGFLPARNSSTWACIQEAGSFCVNILADDQAQLPRRFAGPVADRFNDVVHSVSKLGSPVLDDALAWIDCALHDVHGAGDHLFVLGRVIAFEALPGRQPLLFFQGGLGGFVPINETATAPQLEGLR